MFTDIWTMIWKEWREYFAGAGRGARGVLLTFALTIAAGLISPLQGGPAWVESALPIINSGIAFPLLLVLGVAADSFAGERERHTLETLLASPISDQAILYGKIAAGASYAWFFSIVTALTALIVANLAHLSAGLRLYPPSTVLAIVVLGLLVGLFAASGGCLISLRAATVRQAQQIVSAGFFLVLMAIVLAAQALGPHLQPLFTVMLRAQSSGVLLAAASVALLVVDALLVAGARVQFRRSRLITA